MLEKAQSYATEAASYGLGAAHWVNNHTLLVILGVLVAALVLNVYFYYASRKIFLRATGLRAR